jgi:hypothetical protein
MDPVPDPQLTTLVGRREESCQECAILFSHFLGFTMTGNIVVYWEGHRVCNCSLGGGGGKKGRTG